MNIKADDIFDILEQADPKMVAAELERLNDNNWGLALPSGQPSSVPVGKLLNIINPQDCFDWMNEF
ncbi:MAG: hypothetical protein Q7R43_05065 [Candidatus Daviesbacteria bacterium]|nr:hypothetical protein [Candidatus Daviesbacteria bacterium]